MTKRKKLYLKDKEIEKLNSISNSDILPDSKIKRAKILLLYSRGLRITDIAHLLGTNRPLVERVIDKALILDPLVALEDLPREGRPRQINNDAVRWILSIAKQNPVNFGYSKESWSYALLSNHLQKNCVNHGHECLIKIGKGKLHTILKKNGFELVQNKHLLENEDLIIDPEPTKILCTHKSIEIKNKSTVIVEQKPVFTSSAEHRFIPSLKNISVKSKHASKPEECKNPDFRPNEQQSVALLAGIDLHTGKVFPMASNRYHSEKFINFLKLLDCQYPKPRKIQLVIDKNPTYISRELIRFLKAKQGRFNLNFAPKQGAWLNLIELFYTRTLRSIIMTMQFQNEEEFMRQVSVGIEKLNQESLVSRWKHKVEEMTL